MTFEKLDDLIGRHNIPRNVRLMSDSGWECDETEMDGVWYNQKENIIVFTQEPSSKYDRAYFEDSDWKDLYESWTV